jgi:succinyl-CoA synthetase beta subunit
VDIEDVAERTPERIKKVPIDIHIGVTDEIATELAVFLGFQGKLLPQSAEQIQVTQIRFARLTNAGR